MIVFVFGTTGELIKIAPVLARLPGPPEVVTACTGQQATQIEGLARDLGLAPPTLWVARGRNGHDLERARDIPPWMGSVVRSAVRDHGGLRKRLRSASSRPLFVVHGDTLTTWIGALWGRALGVDVAHIEAGLRSGSLRNPFPEELDRRITSRLARLHFAPGAWAEENLRRAGVRGEIVDTGANTIRDALAMAAGRAGTGPVTEERFALASLHRFELLRDRSALRAIVEVLREAAEEQPILFVDHPVTAAAVRDAGLDDLFGGNLRRLPRQRYVDFVAVLRRCRYIVTDSGGSQEECAALGIPCLVHRERTERHDGLDGGSVVLSGMSLEAVRDFLADPEARRREPDPGAGAPSDTIVRELRERGYL